jgi:hypothetical protein
MARQILVFKQLILAKHECGLTGKVGQKVGKTVKSARTTQKKYNKGQQTATLQPRFQASSITRHAVLLAVSQGNQGSNWKVGWVGLEPTTNALKGRWPIL